MTSTLPPLVQAISGALGSATANGIVYPLDLIATRLQTTASKRLKGFAGVLRALRFVLEREGWRGLYDGLPTDTAATLTSNFLYFYFYSFLRALLIRRRIRNYPSETLAKSTPILLGVVEEVAIGFIAGVTSRAISTPLSVTTVRLQTEGDGGCFDAENGNRKIEKQRGVLHTVSRIYNEQGLTGFWRGFSTTIPLSLNPAITLFLFQIYRRIAARGSQAPTLGTPSASSSFIGAAFSNVVATWLLYPLMLAKTRLQIQRNQAREDPSIVSIWEDALRREGSYGLYQGIEAQMLKGFISQGVTMVVKQRVEFYIVALYLARVRKRSI